MAEKPSPKVAVATRKVAPTKQKQRAATDSRTYACQVCSQTFGSSTALRSHCFATEHLVRCSVCDKGFVTNEALQQHAHIHAIDAMLKITRISKDEQVVTLQEVNERADELGNPTISGSTIQDIGNISLKDSSFRETAIAQEQVIDQKDGLLYKSNVYTLLTDTEKVAIYQYLLASCHAIETLDAEQYTLQVPTERIIHSNVPYSAFRQTPQALQQPKRKVVAIDCEMVGLWRNTDCVALLCAVDVLTGETLVNTYVDPVSKVLAWRSTVSGITRRSMTDAIEQGQALQGWTAAREALWEYIDAETIIVGHALQNDLNVLGIFHPRIVDTAILASQAVFPETENKKFPESYGLKRLLLSWLNMTIQTGMKGHDCLEDTLATRELAIWCARNPDVLKSWGLQMRVAYDARKLAIRQAREEAKRRAKEAAEKNAKEGADKVVIADVKNKIKLNIRPEARKEFRRDWRKDIQKDVTKDANVDARNDWRKNTRSHPRNDSRKQGSRNEARDKQEVKQRVKVDTLQDANKSVKTDGDK